MVTEWHSNLRSVRETSFDQILFVSESLLHDLKDAYNIWALSIRFDRINKRNLVSVILQRIHHQLHATKSDASLEFLVLSQLKLIGLKTWSAVSVEEARWLATMVMLSSAMVSRVRGLGEHILSTVMIWGGAASNQSPMADTFSRIVPRVLCFGEHLLSTVIIWEGAISNHEFDIPELFPIPPKKLQLPPFEPTHTIRRTSSQKLNIYYTLTLLWINAKRKTRNENSKQIPLTFFSGPQLSVCKQDPTARRKSKLLKGGISFEETKPPWKNAKIAPTPKTLPETSRNGH
jgi:hypothetical protein